MKIEFINIDDNLDQVKDKINELIDVVNALVKRQPQIDWKNELINGE